MKIRDTNHILLYGEKEVFQKFDEEGKLLDNIDIIDKIERAEKYTWEKDGKPLMDDLDNKYFFSNKENYILKQLFKENSIPKEYHPKIWLISSGAKNQIENNKNYYNNLFNDYFNNIPSSYEKQIDKDVMRTFSDNNNQKDLIVKLKNILIAYARRNITIGYCQGFNLIIGKLLEIYNGNEEEVFWLFSQLIEVILPSDYYLNLIGIITDASIINEILEMKFELCEKMQMYFQNKILILLTSLFNENVNENTLYAIYDSLFLCGNITIFKTILFFVNYLTLNYDFIENDNFEFEEIINYNDDLIKNIGNLGISNLRNELFDYENNIEFPMEMLNKKRLDFKKEIIEEVLNAFQQSIKNSKNNSLMRNSLLNFNFNNCNLDWPLCIYDNEYRYKYIDYFVFKSLDQPNLINDYFFSQCNNIFDDKINDNLNSKDIFRNLLIERRNHFCEIKTNNLSKSNSIFDNSEVQEENNFIKGYNNIQNELNNFYNDFEIIDLDEASKIFEKVSIIRQIPKSNL